MALTDTQITTETAQLTNEIEVSYVIPYFDDSVCIVLVCPTINDITLNWLYTKFNNKIIYIIDKQNSLNLSSQSLFLYATAKVLEKEMPLAKMVYYAMGLTLKDYEYFYHTLIKKEK